MKIKFFGNKPNYATKGAAGADLVAAGKEVLYPGEYKIVYTGSFVEIPKGKVGLVCPRSGLAARHGITVLNAPGIIDSDYRGEIGVILINLGTDIYEIQEGERIAQLVIASASHPVFSNVARLSSTKRGAGGFGSTGRK